MLSRSDVTALILDAKMRQGLTFEAIAEKVGRHVVWTTSALHGQQSMSREEAVAVCEVLELDEQVAAVLQTYPSKGDLDDIVPTDPLLYRFYEIQQVYGTTIKAIIHEIFGDGIMSAIDFEMNIERKSDPKGDRVLITLDGKFLPYRKW